MLCRECPIHELYTVEIPLYVYEKKAVERIC
jgi:hypothetical protein